MSPHSALTAFTVLKTAPTVCFLSAASLRHLFLPCSRTTSAISPVSGQCCPALEALRGYYPSLPQENSLCSRPHASLDNARFPAVHRKSWLPFIAVQVHVLFPAGMRKMHPMWYTHILLIPPLVASFCSAVDDWSFWDAHSL